MRLPAEDSRLVQIVDAALDEAARCAGQWLVCRPSCTQCCHGVFAINPLDVLRLGAGMKALRTADPAQAATVEGRAQAWIAAQQADFPGDAESGRLGESEAARERFEEFANDAACPALDPATGLCDVYAWRPMTCRVFGPPVRVEDGQALGHCELCFAGASADQVAACEMPLPHALENRLLAEIGAEGKTVVAYALRAQQRPAVSRQDQPDATATID